MQTLPIKNSFEGPVYFEGTVSSTMDVSRRLAAGGAPHGTVITTDFQEAGRGRTGGRPWLGDAGDNLFFTILLRYGSFAAIPAALTLRTGLAVSLAVEDLVPALGGLVRVKWPNDVLILLPPGGRKVAGVLSESDGSVVFIGVGVNVRQAEFPPPLRHKATSLKLALGELGGLWRVDPDGAEPRFTLLELILSRLYREMRAGGGDPASPVPSWRERLEERLYMRGQEVRFTPGEADSGRLVEGQIRGIGPGGELLILPNDGGSQRSFITGELDLSAQPSATPTAQPRDRLEK